MSELLQTFRKKSPREKAATLVVTLLVMVLLSTITVAFMQAVSSERAAARSVANRYQAELAAQAGAESAKSLLVDLLTRYPDSVTVWQNIGGGLPSGTNNEATVLYVRALSSNSSLGARPGQFGDEIQLLGRPLVSLQNQSAVFPVGDLVSALPPNGVEVVNINSTNSINPTPFVGRRSSTNAGLPVTAAQWVYMTNSAGVTNGRYAFWIEDESFKVNLNYATNGVRGTTSLGLAANEIRLDGALASSTNTSLRGANVGNIITARSDLPGARYPSTPTAAFPANLNSALAVEELRFITTPFSAGLDLSRGGFKRFNINSITNGITSPTDASAIRSNLDRIISAITNSNSIPNFGQRFYRLSNSGADVNETNVVSTEHSQIYLNKIAANILDYVDEDSQPTVINNDPGFTIRTGRPDQVIRAAGGGLDGPNSVAAFGVENVPQLYGYAAHARLNTMNPYGYNTNNIPTNLSANFEFTLDHYLEFWNMGIRPIEFGAGNDPNVDYIPQAFIRIANAPGWGTSSSTGQPELEGFFRGNRDHETAIPAGTRVPPGASVLITTAPEQEAREVAPSAAQIISLAWPSDKREFSGVTRYVTTATNVAMDFNRLYTIRRVHSTRQGNNLDSETEILLGNNMGVLQSFPYATVNTRNLMVRSESELNSATNFIDRSRLRGNRIDRNESVPDPLNLRSQEGDPRTLNEQLSFIAYRVGSGPDQTRFFTDGNNTIIGRPNTDWVDSSVWVDPSNLLSGAANAPLIINNKAIQSIGELGYITDSARPTATNPAGIDFSRGGGRTLRIGQPEFRSTSTRPGWYDGNQTNSSRTWASWRLADIFTVKTNISIPGLVNPNGALRDNGAALRSMLHGMTMLPSPDGAPSTASRSVNVANVANAFLSRMTNLADSGMPPNSINPLWERGELSELSLFDTGNQLAGANMALTFDRGREEVVRRSIEMITARGSIFTVYVIGQTLQGQNVTSTARIKQTFEIEPLFQATANGPGGVPASMDDRFNPRDAQDVRNRFALPINYSTKILQTTYD